jgi:hypothetical protein
MIEIFLQFFCIPKIPFFRIIKANDMFELLNSYLFLHKSLPIPGLGTIYMESLPASMDTSTKNMLPPLYYFRFDRYADSPDRELFAYLADQQNVADFEAIKSYTEFSFELRDQINREQSLRWEGVGELKKDPDGNIAFESSLGNPIFMQPVLAKKVIHPDAKHVLLVGDTERTNVEMNQWLNHEEPSAEKRDLWWVYALVIGIVAVIILLFHFSSRGWHTDTIGNQQVLQVDK